MGMSLGRRVDWLKSSIARVFFSSEKLANFVVKRDMMRLATVFFAALVLVLAASVSCQSQKRECGTCQCSCGDNILNDLMSPGDKRNATGHRRGSYEDGEDEFVDELDDDHDMFDDEDDDSEEDVRAYYESWSEL